MSGEWLKEAVDRICKRARWSNAGAHADAIEDELLAVVHAHVLAQRAAIDGLRRPPIRGMSTGGMADSMGGAFNAALDAVLALPDMQP